MGNYPCENLYTVVLNIEKPFFLSAVFMANVLFFQK